MSTATSTEAKTNGQPGTTEAEQFLDALFQPGDSILLRHIESWTDNGHKKSKVDYKGTEYSLVGLKDGAGKWQSMPQRLTTAIKRQNARAEQTKCNVFFGVCPRHGTGGQYDQAWQIRVVRVLWADVDHCTVEEALERCKAAGLPEPSIVVASGNGVHLYWLLAEPYIIDDGDPRPVFTEFVDQGEGKKARKYIKDADGEKLYIDDKDKHNAPPLSAKAQHIQDILAGIAAKIGGDHTNDLARLLRPPGTWNRKDQRNGREPVPCRLVELHPERRYPLDLFAPLAVESPDRRRRETIGKVRLPTPRKLSPTKLDRFHGLLTSCDAAEVGSRSETDFALCCFAVEHGMTRDQVWREAQQTGKFAEAGERYFSRTWSRAEEHTREQIWTKEERKAARGHAKPSGNGRAAEQGNRMRAKKPVKSRPRIDAGNQDLEIVTAQAWEALQASNKPERLFRCGGRPSRIETDDDGAPIVRALDPDRMRYEVARAADWFRISKEEEEVPASPPKDVVRDVLAQPDMPLPVLIRIVEAPIYAADGTLQTSPGYHRTGRIYYAPAIGLVVPDISAEPTPNEISTARQLVCEELLGDFPITSESELAHAVALFLLPFAREIIGNGATPIHLVEKPSPGTGATLMVDCLAYPAIGRPVAAMTEGRDEEEWRKRLTSKFRMCATYIFIDNLGRRLDSPTVSAAVTAPSWEDRILGHSEIIRVPVRCVWVASGNNPSVSNEISRRTIRIRLDAKTDQPWLREGFRIPNLRAWVKDNRGRLIWAALTMIRAWLVAGRPAGSRTLGMFEQWAETIGGILDVVGIPGFLGNLDDFYQESDAESAAWQSFILAWWERFQDQEVKVAELWETIKGDVMLPILADSEQAQKIRLGKLLSDKRDRTFSVEIQGQPTLLRITRGGQKQRAYLWKLGECGE
ncbi:MAG: hypothetical protein ABSF26_28465 [Thermoguttaceae bacterium]